MSATRVIRRASQLQDWGGPSDGQLLIWSSGFISGTASIDASVLTGTIAVARLPSTVIRSGAGVQTIQPSSAVNGLLIKAFNTSLVTLLDIQTSAAASIATIRNDGQIKGDSFFMANGSTGRVSLSTTNMLMASNISWFWKSSGDVSLGSADTGFNRNAAGQVAILSTPGNFGGIVVGNGSSKYFETNSTGWAFNGQSPSATASVTGSRSGNAALADLLTKLAAKGIITDGTSA